jgi:hypothetical protein
MLSATSVSVEKEIRTAFYVNVMLMSERKIYERKASFRIGPLA